MKKIIIFPVLLMSLMLFAQRNVEYPYSATYKGTLKSEDTLLTESYIKTDSGVLMTQGTITQGNWDTLSGYTVQATTIEGLIQEVFYPSGSPLCDVSTTDPTTYEYQGFTGTISVDISYWVKHNNNPVSHPLITDATITCSQSVGNFVSGSFHNDDSTVNQTGSQTTVVLVGNTTNTFTTYGMTGDGKTCTSTLSYTFDDKRYWFTDADGVITDAEITAATNQDFSNAYSAGGVTYTFNSVADAHIVIACPYHATYPTEAAISGFNDDISNYFDEYDDGGGAEYTLTNASVADRDYKVLVSDNKYGTLFPADVVVVIYQ